MLSESGPSRVLATVIIDVDVSSKWEWNVCFFTKRRLIT